jgi:signal peptidase I
MNNRTAKNSGKLLNAAIFAVIATLAAAALTIVFNGYNVVSHDGDSMNPTISSGERTLVKTRNYTVKRFDIVNVSLTSSQAIATRGVSYINKRVIGMPGETVEIKDDIVYIDGMQLDEPFSRIESGSSASGKDMRAVTLGNDEYFVMGDNRDASSDSRSFGAVKASQIKALTILPKDENLFEKGLHEVWNLFHQE